MAGYKCPEHHQVVPVKFRRESETRDDSKLGRFILAQNKTREEVRRSSWYADLVTMNKMELLRHVVLDPEVDVRALVDSLSAPKEIALRGNLYEALWDVVVKLNRLPTYNDHAYHHCVSKIEDGGMFVPITLNHNQTAAYLESEKVMTGSKAGISDITLQEKTERMEDAEWACARKFTGFYPNNFVLCSAKYYTREKHIDDYNIQEIAEVVTHTNGQVGRTGKIDHKVVLFIRSKTEFDEMVLRTTKKAYKEDIADVFDMTDLCDIVGRMRNDATSILEKLVRSTQQKPSMMPRFHQLLFVHKTIDAMCSEVLTEDGALFLATKEKQVLWGQIARSGKTYCAGLLISRLKDLGFYRSRQALLKRRTTTLVITPAPTETLDQFKKEMFDLYLDFDTFKCDVYDPEYIKKQEQLKANKEVDKKRGYYYDTDRILVCSKQFLQGTTNTKEGKDADQGDADEGEDEAFPGQEMVRKMEQSVREKCGPLADVVDIIIIDEAHYGASTAISKMILMTIDPNDTALKIYLTATYKKPVDAFGITDAQLMTWGLNEIRLCKFMSDESAREELYELYGRSHVAKTIDDMKLAYKMTSAEVYTFIEKEYQKYPSIHVLTSQFDPEKVKDIQRNNIHAYGFDMNALFLLREAADGRKCFANELSLTNITNYIAQSVYPRMERTLREYGQHRPFTSQLWFLPFFTGNPIRDIAVATQRLLTSNPYYKEFEVLTVLESKQGKDDVKKAELMAMHRGKRGLIILVGKKFSLGVSLPCVDAVFFLNNDTEVDVIYQRMFRSLTESHGKHIGFVVDMNPYRSITALLEYSSDGRQKTKTKDQQMVLFKNLVRNKTIYVDDDLVDTSSDTKNALTMKDLYKSVGELIKKNFATKRVADIQKAATADLFWQFVRHMRADGLEQLFSEAVNKDTKRVTIVANRRGLGKGAANDPDSRRGNPSGSKPESKVGKKEVEKADAIAANIASAWWDIMVLFAVLLSNAQEASMYRLSFEGIVARMVERFDKPTTTCKEGSDKEGVTLMALFDVALAKVVQHLKTIANTTPCETFLLFLGRSLTTMRRNNMCLEYNRHFEDMKAGMADIDDSNPAKLYAFIEEHLPPKTVEKKTNGEVFTPLPLVREMLGAIETYADKAFWTNPDLKILDPAAGIGNFPLIAFEKLMEGLKKRIPSAAKRTRHILGKMLYMVELNGNNTRMMRRIFNGKEYKLNIVKGDFLSPKTHKKLAELMGVAEPKFDLVMGNPPWQDSVDGKRTGGYGGKKPLWEKFVNSILDKQLLQKTGLLLFMHPPSWRKPEHDLWQEMTKRQILYLSIHSESDSSKTFKVKQRYDWYLMRNSQYTQKSVILDEHGKITTLDFRKWPFVPNSNYKAIEQLLAKNASERCDCILYDTMYHTQKTDKVSLKVKNGFPFECIHTLNQKGVGFAYAKHKVPDHFLKKVVLSFGRHQYPYNDYKGEKCMTQITYGIPIRNKSEGDDIIRAFNTQAFKEIIKATKWSTFITDWRMFNYFKSGFWKEFL
jgi:N-6 DNA Methylase/Type III restriction enzyme, res subunit